MKISEIIKFNRKLKKMTQSELGEKLGVSQDTISIWETGKAQPNYDAIQKMCIVFNLTGDEILQIETNEQRRNVNINSNGPFTNNGIINSGNISSNNGIINTGSNIHHNFTGNKNDTDF